MPDQKRQWRLRALAVGVLSAAIVGASLTPALAADQETRPILHFTPEKNWVNDPNGLVFHDGVYHLYFQHNPEGAQWGNMSWGHATSTDLVNWEQQELAIPQTKNAEGESVEDIFSGSVVVDENNSSGFGTAKNPPLVAIYTSAYTQHHPTLAGRQAQSLAYSLDDGYTWTKFEGNPVLDRGSANFRDPKVFWYEGEHESYWVMTAVEATEHKVVLYRSDDLVDWTHLSDFGPANATGGVWECPDLFPLAVDGDPDNVKWVMVVNLNPGAVAGGSGGQYFVGDFDGTTFTADNAEELQKPPGDTLADFEGADYGEWTASGGTAFGDGPVAGEIDGQQAVSGQYGTLANSFHGGDAPTGVLRSPEFTISDAYLSFLVGGGRHPHADGTRLDNTPPEGALLFDGFEGDASLVDAGWALTGDFADGVNPSRSGGENAIGSGRINTHDGGPRGDDNTGTITSPEFEITDDWLSMLVGGGHRDAASGETLEVQVVVGDEVVATTAGENSGFLNWKNLDVSAHVGETARVRLVDEAAGAWGHLTLDHLVLGAEQAQPVSSETSVNLVVDGEVVRTATGADSEALDWVSWPVDEWAGRTASIEIVDNNRAGWGHVLADEFQFGPSPVPTNLQQYDWLDWGRDYYATVSFNNVPDDRRLMLGWMNNWQYAGDVPTGDRRGGMTLPREVSLTDTPDGPRLVQRIAPDVEDFAVGRPFHADTLKINGHRQLPVAGETLALSARLEPGDADEFGIEVLASGDEATVIGYDTARQELFVDRTGSGQTAFNPAFASVERVPLALPEGGLDLTIVVDRTSVEVFADGGRTTITDLVFPAQHKGKIRFYASGGKALAHDVSVQRLGTED